MENGGWKFVKWKIYHLRECLWKWTVSKKKYNGGKWERRWRSTMRGTPRHRESLFCPLKETRVSRCMACRWSQAETVVCLCRMYCTYSVAQMSVVPCVNTNFSVSLGLLSTTNELTKQLYAQVRCSLFRQSDVDPTPISWRPCGLA